MIRTISIFLILALIGCVTGIEAKPYVKPSLKMDRFDNESDREGTESRLLMVGDLLYPEDTDEYIDRLKKRLKINVGLVLSFRVKDICK